MTALRVKATAHHAKAKNRVNPAPKAKAAANAVAVAVTSALTARPATTCQRLTMPVPMRWAMTLTSKTQLKIPRKMQASNAPSAPHVKTAAMVAAVSAVAVAVASALKAAATAQHATSSQMAALPAWTVQVWPQVQ